jgi:putative SOS response-associated peptidase YedK
LSTFNARAETVATKPMFRSAFKRNRCITPASGYYEWQTAPDGKQPYYFTAEGASMLSIAGLWDEWKDNESGKVIKSCTMIITEPNKLAAKIHDRMPVLFSPGQFASRLSGKAGTEILKPAPERMQQMWPVPRRVNSSRANGDDGTLIDKLAA